MKKTIIIFLILLLFLTGCSKKEETSNSSNTDQQSQIASTTESLISDDTKLTNEEELVEYVEGIDEEINSIINSNSTDTITKDKLKNTYKRLTDFIFYDGTIKGKTFKELSAETKEKILNLYLTIDEKIEQVEPNYKENIASSAKNVYTSTKEKVIKLKEEIKSQYKEQVGQENYDQTIRQYEEGKKNLEDTYEVYKPSVETVKDKAKETYEKNKDKISSWWNERK